MLEQGNCPGYTMNVVQPGTVMSGKELRGEVVTRWGFFVSFFASMPRKGLYGKSLYR